MEAKQISRDDQSPSPYTTYKSFIARNQESYNQLRKYNFRRRQVKACFHDWVILSNCSGRKLSLWNPLTSMFIRLPTLTPQENNDSYEYCLSLSPDDQCLVLLLFSKTVQTIVFCRLGRRKTEGLKWTEISYDKQITDITGRGECFLKCPTCCNGKVYAMITNTMNRDLFVVQVDIVVEGREDVISLLRFVEVPYDLFTCFPTRNRSIEFCYFLKGTCTELFYIEVCFRDNTRIIGVSLLKLDVTSMMWEEVEDLKDALFFIDLSTFSVFYKSLVASEIGGYVHVFYEVENISYSFYVKDRTMSFSPISISCSVQKAQVLVWAMLECGLEVDHHHESKQDENDKDIEIAKRPIEIESDSTSESCLLNAPFDILKKIMEHCVGVEYMNLRATCKCCYLATPQIQWSNKTTLKRLHMYSVISPWFMVQDNVQGVSTFIDPISGNKYFINTPQILKGGCHILFSSYGWLLCHTLPDLQLWFFNPFTRNVSEVREPPHRLNNLCFSAPPGSRDCIVVGFTSSHVYYIHFAYQQPLWRSYDLDFVIDDPYSYVIPTFIGNDLYVMFNNERVEAFRDMGKEDFSRVVVVDKAPRSSCISKREYFLSNCDQNLYLVIVAETEEFVKVFKLDDSTKEWETIDSIGKYMIYISHSSCICLEAKSPKMENKIYFPRLLHSKDTKMVFYSLDTCRYHTFDEKHIKESSGVDLSDTKYYCCPQAWIEPSWS